MVNPRQGVRPPSDQLRQNHQPGGIRTLGEFPNLTEALLRHGFSEHQVRKIMGENWVRVLGEVWGE
ncbi:hypothetical protein GGER_35350 [Serratia rubidaea]